MKPEQKKLIEKMAGIPKGLKSLVAEKAHDSPAYARMRASAHQSGKEYYRHPSANQEVMRDQGASDAASAKQMLAGTHPYYGPRTSTQAQMLQGKKLAAGNMRDIIDDLIKGAKDNTFGRPIAIQADTQDWTALDTAKCAGMLVALDEQGYSLKEASEFLGLPESKILEVIESTK